MVSSEKLLALCSMLSAIIIEQIRPELTWQLRRDILYPELTKQEMGMPEDADGMHFAAFKDIWIVGIISLFHKNTDFQFRKLAVAEAVQGEGIGSALLQQVTEQAIADGGDRIWCNARISATGFYLKHDFAQTGKFLSKNGYDYEVMEKKIIPFSDHSK